MQNQSEFQYGKYETQSSSDYQTNTNEQVRAGEKIYAPQLDSKNKLRFTLATMALATIIIVAILCVVANAGGVSWIGFGLASLAIFLIAVVTVDKIQ